MYADMYAGTLNKKPNQAHTMGCVFFARGRNTTFQHQPLVDLPALTLLVLTHCLLVCKTETQLHWSLSFQSLSENLERATRRSPLRLGLNLQALQSRTASECIIARTRLPSSPRQTLSNIGFYIPEVHLCYYHFVFYLLARSKNRRQ